MDLVALLSLCERLPSVVLLILRFSLPSEDAEVNLTLFFFRLDLSLLLRIQLQQWLPPLQLTLLGRRSHIQLRLRFVHLLQSPSWRL